MRLLFILLLAASQTACAQRPFVVLAGESFEVEIADDPDEQALGLMYRESLPDSRGMLFIFPDEAPRSFWMKNTRIALDILYFDADQTLVSMQQDVPPCRSQRCPGYPSEGPAQFVLELNAGTAGRLGVSAGDKLIIEL